METVIDQPEVMLLIAAGAVAAGFAMAVIASRRAVSNAAALAAGTRIPPFVIGITLLSIGTDLPEIANSVVASLAGLGDINVGDSVGSAATQSTLVLGLLPILGGAFIVGRRRVATVGGATVAALLLGAALMSDGSLGRIDALVLISAWIAGSTLTWRNLPSAAQPELPVEALHKARQVGAAIGALAMVVVGATVALWGLTEIAKALSAPQYLIAFFIASIGTSLPELAVTVSAIRQGQRDLAVGDALGSSFVDSTLSIAAGPLIAPITVTTSLVVPGSIAVALVVTAVVVLLFFRRRHDWATGVVLIALYIAFYLLWVLT